MCTNKNHESKVCMITKLDFRIRVYVILHPVVNRLKYLEYALENTYSDYVLCMSTRPEQHIFGS